jgi:outer membrane protein TolC
MHRFLGLVVVLVATTARADVLPRVLFQPADPTGPGAAPPPPTPPPPVPVNDLTSWAGPAKATSLPELLQLAVRQAPALQSARIDIAIAAARIEQTYARDDWQIRAQTLGSTTAGRVNGQDVDHIYTFTGNVDLFRVLPTGGTVTFHAGTNYSNLEYSDPDANAIFGGTSWTHDLSAGISQPLLRGRGRWLYDAQERIATISRDAIVLGRRLAAIQTVQTVVAAYWDLVLAERQIAITQSSLELAKERLRITQIGNQGGKVPRSEIPAVQQIIATREEDVLNGELAVLDRSFTLRRAVGMPIGKGELGLRLGAELQTREATFDLGALTERAFTASPELAQIAKQDQARASRSSHRERSLAAARRRAVARPDGHRQPVRHGREEPRQVRHALGQWLAHVPALVRPGERPGPGARAAREPPEARRHRVRPSPADRADDGARGGAARGRAAPRRALAACDRPREREHQDRDRSLQPRQVDELRHPRPPGRAPSGRAAPRTIDDRLAQGQSVVQALTGDILPAYGITVE